MSRDKQPRLGSASARAVVLTTAAARRPSAPGTRLAQPFLVGRRVYLRAVEESDISDDYVGWLNDHEVTRYLPTTGKFPSSRASIRKYLERFHNSTTDMILAIIDRQTNLHIGNVTLNHINWLSRTADTGLLIGRKEFWGKGYAFEVWSLLLVYAFERLHLRKIVAGAAVKNTACVATLKKLGFQIEGRLRQEILVDGRYEDAWLFRLFQDEFCSDTGRSAGARGTSHDASS